MVAFTNASPPAKAHFAFDMESRTTLLCRAPCLRVMRTNHSAPICHAAHLLHPTLPNRAAVQECAHVISALQRRSGRAGFPDPTHLAMLRHPERGLRSAKQPNSVQCLRMLLRVKSVAESARLEVSRPPQLLSSGQQAAGLPPSARRCSLPSWASNPCADLRRHARCTPVLAALPRTGRSCRTATAAAGEVESSAGPAVQAPTSAAGHPSDL